MPPSVSGNSDIQEKLAKIWLAKGRIALFALSVFMASVCAILFLPRTYRSEARVYLQLGRESVGIDPTGTTGQTKGVQITSREDEIVSAMEVIKGRGLISKVVEEVTPEVVLGHVAAGTDDSPAILDELKRWTNNIVQILRSIDPQSDHERAITVIERELSVDAERKSEVIRIGFSAETPQLAQRVVDAILKIYEEEHLRLHRTDGSLGFFEEQQGILGSELNAINRTLRDAKNRMGIASIDGQRYSVENQNREIQQNITDTELALSEASARLEKLQREQQSVPERIASQRVEKSNSATDMQSQQLYALQLQEIEYQSKYSDSHPLLVAVRAKVREAESQYQNKADKTSERTDDINPIHREISLDILKTEALQAGLQKKLDKLQNQRTEVEQKLQELNSFEIEIADLERESKLREKKYLTYSESLEQARINQELEKGRISSIVIAQPATFQEKPVSPSKPLIALVGLAITLLGSLLVGLISLKMDDRMLTPDCIQQKTGLAVLAVIPKSKRGSI